MNAGANDALKVVLNAQPLPLEPETQRHLASPHDNNDHLRTQARRGQALFWLFFAVACCLGGDGAGIAVCIPPVEMPRWLGAGIYVASA